MDTDSSESEEDANDDGVGIDEEVANRLVELRTHLQTYPLSYDGHLEYVQLIRKTWIEQNRDESLWTLLGGARESFAREFPLSQDLWLDWIRDSEETGASPEKVCDLARRAVEDYPTPALWRKRLGLERARGDEESARSMADKAIESCGAHVSEGAILWEEYLDFEKEATLRVLQGTDTPPHDIDVQRERVGDVCKRALSLPLVGLEEIHEACLALREESGITGETPTGPSLAEIKESSVKELEAREFYEAGLAKEGLANEEGIKIFHKYLKYEQKYGSATSVLALFQRMVCKYPCYEACWEAFGAYLEIHLKDKDLARKTYWRGVRNCPWSCKLWIRAMATAPRSEQEARLVSEQEGPLCPLQADLLTKALENSLLLQALTVENVFSLLLMRAEAVLGEKSEKDSREFLAFAFDRIKTLFPQVAAVTELGSGATHTLGCELASVFAAQAVPIPSANAQEKAPESGLEQQEGREPKKRPCDSQKERKRDKGKKAKKPKKSEVAEAEPRGSARQEEPPKRYEDACTLFVKNLAADVDQGALTDLLGGEDVVTGCRVVTDRRTGKSKGFAYVDFKNEQSLQEALKKDGTEVSGRALSLAKSKPPPKKERPPSQPKTQESKNRAKAQPSTTRKTNINLLVPRKVEKKSAQNTPKSNDDFRKLLLGNGKEG